MTDSTRWLGLRSLIESPLLDERKWAKVPDIAADGVLVDLEDTVVPDDKVRARERALGVLSAPEALGDRAVIVRINNLDTPWGEDDLRALAEAGFGRLAYPKVRSPDELERIHTVLRDAAVEPALFPVIETAEAVVNVERIASIPSVAGLLCGVGDLTAEMGIDLHEPDGTLNPVALTAKARVVLAAAARRLLVTDVPFVADIHDEIAVRAQVAASRRMGFTAMVAFYPPHIAIINELFRPSAEELDEARSVVARFEAARAEGRPAVVTESGRVILSMDYARALRVLDQAAAT